MGEKDEEHTTKEQPGWGQRATKSLKDAFNLDDAPDLDDPSDNIFTDMPHVTQSQPSKVQGKTEDGTT